MGGGSSRQARRGVCRPWWSDTHNGFRLAACPLSGGLEIALRRFLSIDTHGSSKLSNLGGLSQQGCQLNRRRQRRNWRVRAVERGQRSEPAWLRAHPGLRNFEPEKLARTQIPRNVWDTGTAGTGDGVNYNSQRNLAKRKLAPHKNRIKRPLRCQRSTAPLSGTSRGLAREQRCLLIGVNTKIENIRGTGSTSPVCAQVAGRGKKTILSRQ